MLLVPTGIPTTYQRHVHQCYLTEKKISFNHILTFTEGVSSILSLLVTEKGFKRVPANKIKMRVFERPVYQIRKPFFYKIVWECSVNSRKIITVSRII